MRTEIEIMELTQVCMETENRFMNLTLMWTVKTTLKSFSLLEGRRDSFTRFALKLFSLDAHLQCK